MIEPDFDYSLEQQSDIAFIDMKSFYASVECVDLGLNPLRASLCVMSHAGNSAGLILASSPTFKQIFGNLNVSRSRELPFHLHNRKFNYSKYYKSCERDWNGRALPPTEDYIQHIEAWAKQTHIVPPRMNRYIAVNMEIQHLIERFAPRDEIFWYSIDEGFVDLTGSLNYFYPDSKLSRKEKLDLVSRDIQELILKETGIYSTVGMSNCNPMLAKVALDHYAKHNKTMRASINYEDVPKKLWTIADITEFWGINRRTKKRLEKLGIHTIYDLAHTDPKILKEEFGVVGVQLFFHANGIDESNVKKPYHTKSRVIGNSQTLPRDYHDKDEIEIVIKEMAEQVGVRLRRDKKKTTCIFLYVGFAMTEDRKSIRSQVKIEPTNRTDLLIEHIIRLFRSKYKRGAVRRVGVSYSGLTDESYSLVSLFDDYEIEEKKDKLQESIDLIRDKYGYISVQKATALSKGSRVIERTKLVGGHSGGGAGGLDGLSKDEKW